MDVTKETTAYYKYTYKELAKLLGIKGNIKAVEDHVFLDIGSDYDVVVRVQE